MENNLCEAAQALLKFAARPPRINRDDYDSELARRQDAAKARQQLRDVREALASDKAQDLTDDDLLQASRQTCDRRLCIWRWESKRKWVVVYNPAWYYSLEYRRAVHQVIQVGLRIAEDRCAKAAKRAAAEAKTQGLPALKGTDREVQKALVLRQECLRELSRLELMIPADADPGFLLPFHAFKKWLYGQRTAAFWIETQHVPLAERFPEFMERYQQDES